MTKKNLVERRISLTTGKKGTTNNELFQNILLWILSFNPTMSQFLVLFFYIQCLLETFGVLLNLFYMYSRCLIKIWYETFCHSFIKKTDLRISDDLRKSGKEWHHTFRDSSSIIGSEGPEGGWGNQIDLPPWEKHQKHLRAMGLMTP